MDGLTDPVNTVNKNCGSQFILRSNSNYEFCLNKLLICCLLIVSKTVVKFKCRYWVGLGK